MFTGIVAATGQVTAIDTLEGDVRLSIHSSSLDFSDLKLGESIATSGVCLTVVDWIHEDSTVQGFIADVSLETLSLTTIKHWQLGTPVNLEKALTLQDRLGGHLVSGHVDGIGKVLEFHPDARAWRYTLEAPKDLMKYIARKGSICVDGTSLTVNTVDDNHFELAIVPHTLQMTIMSSYEVGTEVNLEVDLIARHLEKLIMGQFVTSTLPATLREFNNES